MLSEYSHKGWFGICPVYVGNLMSDCMKIAPRWEVVVPLFWVSEKWQGMNIWVRTVINPDYVPEWKVRITGELNDLD